MVVIAAKNGINRSKQISKPQETPATNNAPKTLKDFFPPSLQAVTFDFWDTIYIDPPEIDQERTRRRQALLSAFLLKIDKHLDKETIVSTYKKTKEQLSQNNGKPCAFRLIDVVAATTNKLGLDANNFTEEIASLSKEMDELTLTLPPLLAKDIAEVIKKLSKKCALGIISNAGETSGKTLRQCLTHDKLLNYFKVCAFSDERGICKPNPELFTDTYKKLGVKTVNGLHIGDSPILDISGAINAGLNAILVGTNPDPKRPPHAKNNFAKLLKIL